MFISLVFLYSRWFILTHLRRKILPLLIIGCLASTASANAIDYQLTIEGITSSRIEKRFAEQSLLIKLADKKPTTLAALNRRIANDTVTLQHVLQEFGYYDATISNTVTASDDIQQVHLTVVQGQRYSIEAFTVDWIGQTPQFAVPDEQHLIGQPALPETILDAEKATLDALMENGYPFPTVTSRKLYVDDNNDTVAVVLAIDAGQRLRFGATTIEGLTDLQSAFVERRIDWQADQWFDIDRVVKTRQTLLRSGVIARADISYGDITSDGELPVTITIIESKQRSIGAGAAYSTSRDLIGNVFWEHRNLFGQAESARIKVEGGKDILTFSADLNKPDMWGNTALSWQNTAELTQESLEAYDERALTFASMLNYQYSSRSAVAGGIALEHSEVREDSKQPYEKFILASLPLNYRYDSTNDLLNPRHGARWQVRLTPYWVINEQDSFTRLGTIASHYLPIGKSKRFVWANRVRVAVIDADTLEAIPLDKRLYAGGGGSVRAYGYQLLGPLDANNNPTGGRSAFELGTEGRYMITETIEAVAFVEGGQVSQAMDFSDTTFLWGVGVGARYHTAVGPLRVDIAIPVDKRPVDDSFQLYISIGQAF